MTRGMPFTSHKTEELPVAQQASRTLTGHIIWGTAGVEIRQPNTPASVAVTFFMYKAFDLGFILKWFSSVISVPLWNQEQRGMISMRVDFGREMWTKNRLMEKIQNKQRLFESFLRRKPSLHHLVHCFYPLTQQASRASRNAPAVCAILPAPCPVLKYSSSQCRHQPTLLLQTRKLSRPFLAVNRRHCTQSHKLAMDASKDTLNDAPEPQKDENEDPNVSRSSIGTSFCTNLNVDPSTHAEHMWLEASAAPYEYDDANGKWLMFFPRDQIDAKWAQVKQLYFSGDLDRISSVIVSTAMPSERSSGKNEHVMAFFCGPADDEARVREIGTNLLEKVVPDVQAIYYKSNEQTAQSFSPDRSAANNATVVEKKRTPATTKKSLYRLAIPGLSKTSGATTHQTGITKENVSNDEASASLPLPRSASCNCVLSKGASVMVLDTETTGFPPKASPHDLDSWDKCRMVELAWHMYCPCGQTLSKYAFLVKPDFTYEIPPGAVKVHGITREKALLEGRPIQDIFSIFKTSLDDTSVVVGHNIQFDVRVILAEMHRAKQTALADMFEEIPTDCTMTLGAQTMPSGRNTKLAVLYEECFGEPPSGVMHRADADVEACARIYFFLRYGQEIKAEVLSSESVDGGVEESLNLESELSVDESSVEDEGFSGTDPESEVGSETEKEASEEPQEMFMVGSYETTPTVAALVAVAVGCTALFLYNFGALVL
ncbi:hypothetical protein RvY_13201-2 [Ramazzottius varieornatus]|uniref:Exonuclease domain-containing protein n=1 Tax=Ramazzottius varieornatus TaxID=947166 RepID=A0A1D1VM35_RAMVA|nr:hypothetical protein RvY_13201-2 [Ramazzottius varieornatus]